MVEDPQAWGWLVKGLGGLVNMMSMALDDGRHPTHHWKAELGVQLDRLRAVLADCGGTDHKRGPSNYVVQKEAEPSQPSH